MLSELGFESQMIQNPETVGNTKQWEYRPDIKTVDQMWQYFREILERNNQKALKGRPLTDSEFAQVQRKCTRSPKAMLTNDQNMCEK